MLEIRVKAETTASPKEVVAGACDFSERRAEIWPNVKSGHFQVHTSGEGFAEVTEELWPVGVWERCRYEWRPGSVKATVIDANALAPGSSWELSVTPTDAGSSVEAVFLREFKPGIRGRISEAINRVAGKQLAGSDLRRALSTIEQHS